MTRFCTCSGLASPVDLSRKRKQVDKVTCMTCGRPLVDGIRPPSASMPSTASLELTNFINPELTWKTVTKGFRSATRRSRKPARSLNVEVQQDDKGTKREELSGSESEKLGVAVLERRFADKIAHIPIKKRRILLRSPSPPPPRSPSPYWEKSLPSQHQTSSPQYEYSDRSMDSKCASGQWCTDSVSNWEMRAFNGPVAKQFSQGFENAFVNEKLSEVTNGKLGFTEDFSGIALLAAAACNNSISDDAHNVEEGPIADELLTPEGTDSYRSATPSERTMTSSETGNLILKDSAHEDSIDGSTVQDNSVAVSQNFHDKTESEAGERSASMKDDRLHWDLNTVMEAWELPCDDLNICSQRNGSEGIPDDGVHSEKPEKLESSVHRDPEHALELLKYSTADPEVLTQVFSKDKSLDNSPCPGSDLISGRPLSEEKINTSPTNIVIRTREDCCGTSAIQLSQMVSIESVHLGEHDAVFIVPAVAEKVVCEINSIQSKEDSRKSFELPDDETCPTELVSTVTCQMSDVEYSVSKSEKGGPPHPSPEHENLSALVTTFGEGQPVVAVDVEKKQDKAPPADATPMDSSLHVEPNEFMPKSYECFGQVALEDPIDDGYGSDVSHSVNGHLVGIEKLTVIQAGSESPFEDGELRESVSYSWEENEVEGEPECMDYDSDNRNKDDFDAANYCISEIGSDSCHNDTNGNLAEKVMQSGRANALKESSHPVTLKKFSGQDQLPDGCECSTNRTGEADNVSTPKILAADSMHGLDVDAASTREVELGATRGKLFSHIEGSSCSDALHRQDNVYMQRSRSSYDSCFQTGRVFGSKKYLGIDGTALQMQDGSQGDVHRVDSPAGYWDSRNHRQTGYPQGGAGHPRPRSVSSNSVAQTDYPHQRRSMNFSSKGGYRPFIRRSSPADTDDGYIVHRRMVAARDNSHIRSRGRSGIYQQGVHRGPREEFYGPMSDYPASSSVRLPHYSARSERSFSPVLNSGASFSRPRRKSRSRSRTRSPLTWHLQRERNMGVRRLSKSPDFRSKAQMERLRIPFRKSNFAAADEDVFTSPPRSRFSPESNSRWIDDRNIVAGRFRARKSPGRFFGRSQRLDSGGSPGRMKSDEFFRSMIHPGRFTEPSGGACRGHKYDDSNCERTEYHDKYEMSHRGRPRDTSGMVRRFRYNAEDCFEVRNTRNDDSCIRGTDRRDNIPRSAREERGPFRYNN